MISCEDINLPNETNETNDLTELKSLREKYIQNPQIGYLNINSLRGDKFLYLRDILLNTPIDIFCVDETKLTYDFTDALFQIDGYQFPPLRRDRDTNNSHSYGGGKIVFVKDGIINKRLIDYETPTAETICLEFTVSNRKWFIMFAYRPESIDRKIFFDELTVSLNKAFMNYDYVTVIGDLNIDNDGHTDRHGFLSDMCDIFNLENIISEKTCFKKTGGSSIDVFLTNHKHCFQGTRAIETGLSDHHCLIISSLKSRFQKLPPKKLVYRDKKNFDEKSYLNDLKMLDFNEICSKANAYNALSEKVREIIDKHAPLKTKYLRGNNAPFMTKELRKAIMNRSRLTNRYNRWKSRENFLKLEESRNNVKKLTFTAKKDFFKNASEDGIMTNKKFWKVMKPLMTNKGVLSSNAIIIQENNKLISDEKELVEIFSDHYINIVEKTMGKKPTSLGNPNDETKDRDTVLLIIEKYKDNPIICKIRENNLNHTFSFPKITRPEITKIIKELDTNKSIGKDQIPASFIKIAFDILDEPLTKIFNRSISENKFCEEAKTAIIPPIFKKDDRTLKENYRPVSILTTFGKIFEKQLKNMVEPFVELILSVFISAYRKFYSSNNVLMKIIEDWKKHLDDGDFVGTILMDLSKAFDFVPHDLLIAKLHAYGFDMNSLIFFYSYLKRRKQCVKINNFFSDFQVMLSGVPQGSNLGPILFNIFINDLFLWIEDSDLYNFADDNTLSTFAKNIPDLIKTLENDSEKAIRWFDDNGMMANAKKFQGMILNKNGRHDELHDFKIGGFTIRSKDRVELLGIEIDFKLNFNNYISKICKKAGGQLNTLCRYNKFIDFDEKKTLFESFIQSNFNFCPLVWMFTSPKSGRKIEKVQERALRLLLNDYDSTYDILLKNSKKSSVYTRIHRILAKEVYKTLNDCNPGYMKTIFQKTLRENPRRPNNLRVQGYKGVTYGKNSLRTLGTNIWNNLPEDLKSVSNLSTFNNLIKVWSDFNCTCKMCLAVGNINDPNDSIDPQGNFE